MYAFDSDMLLLFIIHFASTLIATDQLTIFYLYIYFRYLSYLNVSRKHRKKMSSKIYLQSI